MYKIFLDYFLLIISFVIFFIPFLIICIIIYFSFDGPIFHYSKRYGKNNIIFYMPKFRTMIISSPDLPTHLLKNSDSYITYFGNFLRMFSFDELPQIFSVIKRDMSFVGPRPALHNQDDLINLRSSHGIDNQLPGITGWAQINGRDNISIEAKVNLEKFYLKNMSFLFDLKIIFITVMQVFKRNNVKH